jgi:hypothetical protein
LFVSAMPAKNQSRLLIQLKVMVLMKINIVSIWITFRAIQAAFGILNLKGWAEVLKPWKPKKWGALKGVNTSELTWFELQNRAVSLRWCFCCFWLKRLGIGITQLKSDFLEAIVIYQRCENHDQTKRKNSLDWWSYLQR